MGCLSGEKVSYGTYMPDLYVCGFTRVAYVFSRAVTTDTAYSVCGRHSTHGILSGQGWLNLAVLHSVVFTLSRLIILEGEGVGGGGVGGGGMKPEDSFNQLFMGQKTCEFLC